MAGKPTVYIETTVPSYYYETRETPWVKTWRSTTRKWWRVGRSRYELFTSEFVALELQRAPARKRAAAERMIRPLPFLEVTQQIKDLSNY